MALGDIDYTFSMLIAGDSGVGKSCLLLRYTDDTYTENYISTIGVDFKTKTIEHKSDGKIQLNIYDICGQERFRQVMGGGIAIPGGANGIAVIFDIADSISFKNVNQHMEKIKCRASESLPIILVGNKSDLEEQRKVTTEEAKELAESYGIPYIETSAKNSHNVEAAFTMLTEAMITTHKADAEARAKAIAEFAFENKVIREDSRQLSCFSCCSWNPLSWLRENLLPSSSPQPSEQELNILAEDFSSSDETPSSF